MNIGQQVSHYVIQKELGEGGFGNVFLARDLNTGRDVAIKFSSFDQTTNIVDKKQRFFREIACISRINHPGIIKVFDYGMAPDGSLFLSMEFINGISLDKLIRQNAPFPYAYASEIILQVLDALNAAHNQEVVHRDLKPANIMIIRQGTRDFIKILDFGIAKTIDGSTPDLTFQSFDGPQSFGTPQYMAPEQIFGSQVGPYTDLYSIGLVFYEMLTGKPAVSGESLPDIVEKQLKVMPEIPAPYNQGPLADVFKKVLSKAVNTRYQTAMEMSMDINNIVMQKSAFLSVYLNAKLGPNADNPNMGPGNMGPGMGPGSRMGGMEVGPQGMPNKVMGPMSQISAALPLNAGMGVMGPMSQIGPAVMLGGGPQGPGMVMGPMSQMGPALNLQNRPMGPGAQNMTSMVMDSIPQGAQRMSMDSSPQNRSNVMMGPGALRSDPMMPNAQGMMMGPGGPMQDPLLSSNNNALQNWGNNKYTLDKAMASSISPAAIGPGMFSGMGPGMGPGNNLNNNFNPNINNNLSSQNFINSNPNIPNINNNLSSQNFTNSNPNIPNINNNLSSQNFTNSNPNIPNINNNLSSQNFTNSNPNIPNINNNLSSQNFNNNNFGNNEEDLRTTLGPSLSENLSENAPDKPQYINPSMPTIESNGEETAFIAAYEDDEDDAENKTAFISAYPDEDEAEMESAATSFIPAYPDDDEPERPKAQGHFGYPSNFEKGSNNFSRGFGNTPGRMGQNNNDDEMDEAFHSTKTAFGKPGAIGKRSRYDDRLDDSELDEHFYSCATNPGDTSSRKRNTSLQDSFWDRMMYRFAMSSLGQKFMGGSGSKSKFITFIQGLYEDNFAILVLLMIAALFVFSIIVLLIVVLL